MICRDVKQLLNHEVTRNNETMAEASRHAESCEECSQLLVLESLTTSLLSVPAADAEFEPSPFWFSKVKSRIQEMKEYGISSWEAAIMGLRGWIAAFGAVAMLLVALSLQWQLSGAAIHIDHEEELNAQASVEELIGGGAENDSPAIQIEEGRYEQ